MSFCQRCGAEAGDGNYCASCGAQLSVDGSENPYAIGTQAIDGAGIDSDAPEVPGFSQALSICLKKKYACFKGRASRSEFWWYTLGMILLGIATSVIVAVLGAVLGVAGWVIALALVVGLALYLMVPTWAVAVRRYHDIGLSGWLYFLLAVITACLNFATQGLSNEATQAALAGEPAPETPGWYNVAQAVVFAISFVNLIVFVKRGKPDPNKYGPAPVKRPKA